MTIAQKELLKAKPARDGYPYEEDELKLIFSLLPTKENARILAKYLLRTEHAIEEQYQLAMLRDKAVIEKNHDPMSPGRKVAKKMQWIETY